MPRHQAANNDVFALLQERLSMQVVYRDAQVFAAVQAQTGWLAYHVAQAAGAIGKAQGESLLKALEVVSQASVKTLRLSLNSSGAHFQEPMEGLFYLNAFLEALWRFRERGIHITVISDGWLYGGMAMALSAVAHEVVLSESAAMGLLGSRVLAQDTNGPMPNLEFQPPQTSLRRVNLVDWLDGNLGA